METKAGGPLAGAPTWRREPHRLLFPLGIVLAWGGVGHWLVLAVLGGGSYSSVFHSIAQIQGFLMAFAAGFLFTAIPRRTRTAPPASWEMAVACVAPTGTTLAAWLGAIAVAQAFWGVLVLVLLAFVLRRFLSASAGRRPPSCFVWIPLALGIGILGAGLIGAHRALGDEWFWLHDLGQNLVLQGLFLGLIVGLGGMVVPLLTRGEAPPDSTDGPRGRATLAAHSVAAALLVGTFVVEARGTPALGYGARAGLVLLLLLWTARIWKPPTLPGLHRRLVWISAWLLPVGYGLAAADPIHHQAGLHVVFVGGFALMALSVGMHVSLAHAGYQQTARGRRWEVVVFGLALAVAVAARFAMTHLPQQVWLLMGLAAGAFLLGTLAWMLLIAPRLWRVAPPEEALEATG